MTCGGVWGWSGWYSEEDPQAEHQSIVRYGSAVLIRTVPVQNKGSTGGLVVYIA